MKSTPVTHWDLVSCFAAAPTPSQPRPSPLFSVLLSRISESTVALSLNFENGGLVVRNQMYENHISTSQEWCTISLRVLKTGLLLLLLLLLLFFIFFNLFIYLFICLFIFCVLFLFLLLLLLLSILSLLLLLFLLFAIDYYY
jgi:hypothetical protein